MAGMQIPYLLKLIISIVYDVGDFLIGWIPGIGHIYDIAGIILGFPLWGWLGLINAWEVVEFTNLIDFWFPTMSIIALMNLGELFQGGR